MTRHCHTDMARDAISVQQIPPRRRVMAHQRTLSPRVQLLKTLPGEVAGTYRVVSTARSTYEPPWRLDRLGDPCRLCNVCRSLRERALLLRASGMVWRWWRTPAGIGEIPTALWTEARSGDRLILTRTLVAHPPSVVQTTSVSQAGGVGFPALSSTLMWSACKLLPAPDLACLS